MRQTVRSAGLLTLFLLNLTNLSAEPLVRGFFIEKLPGKSANKELSPGKGLVLAHVFNAGNEIIKPGSYQVGVEIENSGKTRSFALKPQENIVSGTLKTFRMAVPVTEAEKKNGRYRIFSKINGNVVWSDKYSFLQGAYIDHKNKVTTLYTEAAPEPDSIMPPREIPFENEKAAKKAAELEKSVAPLTVSNKASSSRTRKTTALVVAAAPTVADKLAGATRPAKNAKNTRTEKAEKAQKAEKTDKTEKPAKAVKPVKPEVADELEEAPVQATRQIDSSEFKKLRTIDEELVIYVIKEGDSLKSIAEKYYGQAAKERTIADLNFIEKPSAIKIGEEIIVDVKPLGKGESVSKSVKTGKVAETFLEGQKTYTIQKGDTLGKIAKEHLGKSSRTEAILKANPGLDHKNLKVGEVIVIPETKGDNV